MPDGRCKTDDDCMEGEPVTAGHGEGCKNLIVCLDLSSLFPFSDL